MSIIRSDEEVGLYINLGVAVGEFISALYYNYRDLHLDIIYDEIIMIVIGFLSFYKIFRNYKILRLVVLYLWFKGINKRLNAYYEIWFIILEHLRTFAYLTVGLLPFIREG